MRVAINLVKDGAAQACVSRRQYRRADGDLALRAEDAARHRPPGDRVAAADAQGRHHRARPRRQRRLHAGAAACSSPSWAARWSRRSTASSGRASACSTSARRTSRATTWSRRPRSCCKASGLNFYGNVEGDDIYKGTTDVVVCDGFVGNVALKTSEGLAQMLADFLREEFTRNSVRKLLALFALPGAERVQAPRRPAPLQRRDAARLEGHRGEEPRLAPTRSPSATRCRRPTPK